MAPMLGAFLYDKSLPCGWEESNLFYGQKTLTHGGGDGRRATKEG